MIVPSFLEYSEFQFRQKVNTMLQNIEVWKQMTHQGDTLVLHLDFVLKNFAKERSVLMSLGPDTVFSFIREFSFPPLLLTVHFMGDTEDLIEVFQYLHTYNPIPDTSYIFYIPPKFTQSWSQEFSSQKTFTFGSWFDLGEWNSHTVWITHHNLLMTVPAGISGQKRLDKDKYLAIDIVESSPQYSFIVDGGWKIQEHAESKNALIVSYSDFWGQFSEKISSL